MLSKLFLSLFAITAIITLYSFSTNSLEQYRLYMTGGLLLFPLLNSIVLKDSRWVLKLYLAIFNLSAISMAGYFLYLFIETY